MKFIIDNWALILVALSSGFMLAWPTLSGAKAGLSPEAAVQLINREKALVIDVCEASEYAGAHIGGAKNIPLAELQKRLPEVVKNKKLPLIFACQSGARAARAARAAQRLGYEQALTLRGGLKAWRAVDLPLEKLSKVES